jgi:hypothetical protein
MSDELPDMGYCVGVGMIGEKEVSKEMQIAIIQFAKQLGFTKLKFFMLKPSRSIMELDTQYNIEGEIECFGKGSAAR